MKKENISRYLQFLLVIIAAGSIFPLIYLRAQYQETISEVYNISLTQMNAIYSVLGVVCILGYFPSGIISDKFSAKNLLSLSLLGTAIGGFWFALVPSYEYVIIIFTIWGFFSVFTFWSSHLKVVKMLSSNEEDGRFFGILDGGKGLVEALLASIALAIFSAVLAGSIEVTDKKSALTTVVYMYSFVLLAVSVLIFLFVKDKTEEKITNSVEAENNKFKFSDLSKVFKNKYIYLHGIILFSGYCVFWTNYYYGGHLQSNLGMSPVTVGSIMVGVLWMRPFGGIIGGFLADKIGKEITITLSLVGGSLCLILMAFIPKSLSTTAISALIIVSGLLVYVIRGTYWSLLGQSKIDLAIMGTAIGTISFIGYLPDIIIPQLNSYLSNLYGNEIGYQRYFLISALVGFIGAFITVIYRKAQLAERKDKTSEYKLHTEVN